ncbi:MAG: hypothetical protein K2Q12_11115 [Rickettsiales bacterium]|nr:hypothetical protein [Rickettsiales bacterium]
MADYYADANAQAGNRKVALNQGGGRVSPQITTWVTGGTQVDTDVVRLFTVPSNGTPYELFIDHAALSGMTDVDVGYYYTRADGGAVIDKDNLADGLSFATAATAKNALSAVTPANVGKRHWELAGLSRDPGGMLDIALTINTAGTANGAVVARGLFVQLG